MNRVLVWVAGIFGLAVSTVVAWFAAKRAGRQEAEERTEGVRAERAAKLEAADAKAEQKADELRAHAEKNHEERTAGPKRLSAFLDAARRLRRRGDN